MLIDHFDYDIYDSGMYNKNAYVITYEYFTKYFEIKINPEQTLYDITSVPSNLELSIMDYILTFI